MAEVRRASAVPLLAVGAALACAGYMVIGAKGDWAFVLAFRGGKLAALALIACAVAVATVLFQTITANRILTPYVMGFDSLYIALQTALVAALGSGAVSALDPRWRFVLEAALMIVLSLALFRWLFTGGTRSIHLLVLAGIVCGVLFRSVAHLLQRILDPNEFSVLQDLMFANFNTVDTSLLGISCLAVLAVAVVLAPVLPTLDVLALGRESAVGLGVDYRATVTRILAGIAILVSVSAALVGPITFFGLVVASLAHQITGTDRHRETLPAACLIAVIALAGGQTIVEHAFGFGTALSMIVEFIGGIFFIALLVGQARR